METGILQLSLSDLMSIMLSASETQVLTFSLSFLSDTMSNTTTTIQPSNLPEAVPLYGLSLQVQEVYPFHDGWNVACFIILLLFILTVLSLAALAVLYELLDCGCCAKDKTHQQLQEEGPGSCSKLMSSICKEPESHTEVV